MMQDRYKFRGKYDGKWYIGSLHICEQTNHHHIIRHTGQEDEWEVEINCVPNGVTEVDPATVGQCTGLKDKNGLTLLFEYDIIDENGRKVGNYYDDKEILEGTTNLLIKGMGTKAWRATEQAAIKRGCFYAE